jgi:hypothetical protein
MIGQSCKKRRLMMTLPIHIHSIHSVQYIHICRLQHAHAWLAAAPTQTQPHTGRRYVRGSSFTEPARTKAGRIYMGAHHTGRLPLHRGPQAVRHRRPARRALRPATSSATPAPARPRSGAGSLARVRWRSTATTAPASASGTTSSCVQMHDGLGDDVLRVCSSFSSAMTL